MSTYSLSQVTAKLLRSRTNRKQPEKPLKSGIFHSDAILDDEEDDNLRSCSPQISGMNDQFKQLKLLEFNIDRRLNRILNKSINSSPINSVASYESLHAPGQQISSSPALPTITIFSPSLNQPLNQSQDTLPTCLDRSFESKSRKNLRQFEQHVSSTYLHHKDQRQMREDKAVKYRNATLAQVRSETQKRYNKVHKHEKDLIDYIPHIKGTEGIISEIRIARENHIRKMLKMKIQTVKEDEYKVKDLIKQFKNSERTKKQLRDYNSTVEQEIQEKQREIDSKLGYQNSLHDQTTQSFLNNSMRSVQRQTGFNQGTMNFNNQRSQDVQQPSLKVPNIKPKRTLGNNKKDIVNMLRKALDEEVEDQSFAYEQSGQKCLSPLRKASNQSASKSGLGSLQQRSQRAPISKASKFSLQ